MLLGIFRVVQLSWLSNFKTLSLQKILKSSFLLPLGPDNHRSVSGPVDVPVLDAAYERSSVSSFTLHPVFKAHPCCKGLTSFFGMWLSSCSVPLIEETMPSPLTSLRLPCWKSTSHRYLGLFPDSWLSSFGLQVYLFFFFFWDWISLLQVYLYASAPPLQLLLHCSKFCNREVWVLQLLFSFSILFCWSGASYEFTNLFHTKLFLLRNCSIRI